MNTISLFYYEETERSGSFGVVGMNVEAPEGVDAFEIVQRVLPDALGCVTASGARQLATPRIGCVVTFSDGTHKKYSMNM